VEEALLHQLLGVLGNKRGNRSWLHWRRLGGALVVAAAMRRKGRGDDCARKRGGFQIAKRATHGRWGTTSTLLTSL
jgi:hypothetical protein